MTTIRREIAVALIALLGALVGVLGGGFVSYVVEHKLSSEQREADRTRANAEREAVARGAARVLRSQLQQAEDRAAVLLREKRLLRWNVRVGLSQSNEQLIAVRLSPDRWDKVAAAVADVAVYAASRTDERSAEHRTVALDEQERRYLIQMGDRVDDGIQALRSLTD